MIQVAIIEKLVKVLVGYQTLTFTIFLVKTIGKTVVWSTYDPFEVVEIFKINFLIERTFWLLHSPLNKHSHLLAELTVCQIATFYIKIAPRRKKLTYV